MSIALQYAPGVPESTKVWFWKLVHSLREEEKALLLKFSTGSPCVPVGGFKNLQVYIHIVAIFAGLQILLLLGFRWIVQVSD